MSDQNNEEIDIDIAGPADVEISLTGSDGTPSEEECTTQPNLSRSGKAASPTQDSVSYSRGTFVFPSNDTGFVQRIELRGNNGAQHDVETVYLLTGETYTTPSELIQLDNPDMYKEMSPTGVRTALDEIAKKLSTMYEDRPSPRLIAHVHTHPNGSTRPSMVDKQGSVKPKQLFDRHFEDFEFFNIIHALGGPVDVPMDKMRKLSPTEGGLWWYGETRRHELAVYDGNYNSRSVVLP